MSRYTIELRSLVNLYGRDEVESWFKNYELSDYLTNEQIETITADSVWNKDRLARDIVDHYFMREIGAETPALFRHYAKITMREVMEEYLQLLYTTAMKYNVLDANDYIETLDRETSQNTSSENTASASSQTSTEGSGISVNSDTPQGQISKQSILGGSYASNTSATETETSGQDTSSTSSEGTQDSEGTEKYTRTIKGRNGKSGAEMIADYRKNILAINKEIINKLNILFMGIY